MNRVLAAGILACLAGHDRSIYSESAVNAQAPAIILNIGVEAIDGTPVRNLGQADFELLVSGVPRPIVSFSAERRPLVLAMLVDISLSMGNRNTPIGEDDRNRGEDARYHRTLESVILQLETGDRAALGRVSAKPALSPASSDSLALSAHVKDVLTVPAIERMGPSPLWDAVIRAKRVTNLLPLLETILAEFGKLRSSNQKVETDEVQFAESGTVIEPSISVDEVVLSS